MNTEQTSKNIFTQKNNYPKWVIRQIFTQVKFINDSNLSPPTITFLSEYRSQWQRLKIPSFQTCFNYHRNASYDDFEIIGSGFRNNTFKRKVAEARFVNKGIMTNFEGSGEVG